MARIMVPAPIGEGLSFRWFVEYVIDNSPLFKTASSLAKASLILGADLDTEGSKPEINESALKLIRDALESETEPLVLPRLTGTRTDDDGKVSEPFEIPLRVYTRFVQALLTDAAE